MAVKIFRVNYKSDFILTLHSDAGWMTPFCIKFWTGAPSQAYFVGFDGTTYTHCAPVAGEPTKLLVQFDDHHLPIGNLQFQIAYHFTVADFPNDTEDEVINPASIIIEINGEQYQVMLDFTGETAPEIEFSLPAYANEAQRIANEEERIAHEEQRVANEEQRVENEQARVEEYAGLKADAVAATAAANDAAALANQKAQLAQQKAGLADDAATLATQKAGLADDAATLATQKAGLANDAAALAQQKAGLAGDAATLATQKAGLANDAATLANQKAQYATDQGDYAKAQGDYAKAQGDTALADHERAESDHAIAEVDHTQAAADHTTATADHAQMTDLVNRADADHEQAATDHMTAVADHTQAASDHMTAVADHTQAASDHSTAASDHNQAVADHETLAPTVAQHTEQITELQNIVADLETIAEGYVRVAGSSSPALSYKSYKYHEQGGFGRESAFSLFYPCLVGTKLTGDDAQVGKILHVLQKLDYGHDIYGNVRKIDGSEGDVLIVNIEPYYRIMGKHTIQGTEYDVFLMSRSPFTWQGIEAERVEKFGWSPDYAVSHTDTDGVVRMHSVFNPEWAGSYTDPYGVVGKFIFSQDPDTGDITETYDETATLLGGNGGLHSTDIALYDGEQRAMNHNPDTTKMVPFANQTAAGAENFFALMLTEGGTFDAHNAALMGSGFSSNDPANAEGDWEESGSGAKNGVRVVDKDGAFKYYGLSGNIKFLTNASSAVYAGSLVNSYRNPWHIMEAHRAVCYAIQNGVHELEWFAFEGNKYKWRSIEGFAGPAQGEMTCVVWKIFATKAGANAVDPTDSTTSIAGNRVEMLVSTALLHGMITQVSPAWNTTGMIMSEDASGNYECYMEREQESLIKIENGEIDATSQYQFEQLYKHVLSVTNGSGYAKNYNNNALMLPDTNANKTGGGLHTYVGKYNYFTGSAASAGKKLVRGFRRGYSASAAYLSPLYVRGTYAPSYTSSSFAFGTCCRITESET